MVKQPVETPETQMSDKEKLEFVFGIHEDQDLVENWDRKVAATLAKDEGIELTDAHWEVVSYLRHFYESTGPIDYARDISAVLEQRFRTKGGLKYVFRLFPNGPVTQGCKIAGIPVPKDSKDPAFGTVA